MASQKILIESELLLLQHRRGDAGALENLTALWERPIYYYVRRLVNSEEEAKDVAQDIWLNVFRKIRTVRDPAAFPAWLYQIARNKSVSHFRKTKPIIPLDDEEAVERVAAADSTPLPSDNAEELHWGLSQLNPLHSECLMLHFLEGFSLEEVASIADVPLGTVKSRIYYAKKALRELLNKEARAHEE